MFLRLRRRRHAEAAPPSPADLPRDNIGMPQPPTSSGESARAARDEPLDEQSKADEAAQRKRGPQR